MRLIYLGSPTEAILPLEYLLKNAVQDGFEIAAVVSRSAKPVGREGKLKDPPLAEYAKNKGIPTLQPESVKNPVFLDTLIKIKPDLMVTCAYGQILNDAFLAIPTRGTINIHPSILPQYRGATPVRSALLNGDLNTGVSILFTVKKLDAGNIILQKEFPIFAKETSGELTSRMFAESGPILLESLKILKSQLDFQGTPQDESKVTLCKKIIKEEGLIAWESNSNTIFNRFRAYHPWPGSFSYFQGKRVIIHELFPNADGIHELQECGEFKFDKPKQSLIVKTLDGFVEVKTLQLEGGKTLPASAFYNGLKDRSFLQFKNIG